MSAPVPPRPWVEVGADAICGHVRRRAAVPHVLYCPECERTALTVLRAVLPLIDAMGASGIRAERQVVADLRAQVDALPILLVDTRFNPDDDPVYTRAVALSDVLALLEGDA